MSESLADDNGVLLSIEATPRSGSWNMATDEYLLEAAIADGLRAVRMYRWDAATVSLGHFQDANDQVLRTRFQNLAAVRRLSGGGAILHHHELTYSFVLPPGDRLTQEPTELYGRVHSAIIRILHDFGADCVMRGENASLTDEPFLCFVRGDRHDIHCAGHKVVGSAQRRRKGAVLQHGSIILKRSPHAPEIPGLEDLAEAFRERTESSSQVDTLETALGTAIAESLGERQTTSDWLADVADQIAELEATRFHTLERQRR